MTKDEAIDKILEGFEEGVFTRNIEGDHKSDWAIKFLPYAQALGVLQVDKEARDG